MYAVRMRIGGLLLGLAGLAYADSRCLPCHPAQVRSYAQTGMGRSISVPTVETSPSGAFEHGPSDMVFRVSSPSGAVLHEMERSGRKAVYSPRWTIGSGNHGSSYVIAIGDALFQSPIS